MLAGLLGLVWQGKMSWEGCWKKGGEACGTSSQEEKRRGRVEGQKSTKLEKKMAILSGKLAIFPDFHLIII